MAKYTITIGNEEEGFLTEDFESEAQDATTLRADGWNALLAQGIETFGWLFDDETAKNLAESAMGYAVELGLTVTDEFGAVVIAE